MSDKEVKVRAHTRRARTKFGSETSEAEESFIAEFPSIAPEHGTKIIDARNEKPLSEIKRGVKRVGGGDHGKIEKGVKRLGY